MRVAFVIYGSLDTISGGYLYDRKLVEYLEARGDQVEIISLPWRNYASHLADNCSRRLINRLRQLDVDILLQDELNHPSLFRINRLLDGSLQRRAEQADRVIPRVAIVHHLRCSEMHPAWQTRIYRQIETHYLKSIHAFIFNSQTTRQAVEDLIGAARRCVVAYPAGDQLKPSITEQEVLQRAGQPGPLRLLFLGNVIPRKGLHILLAALSRLPADQAALTVTGRLDVDLGYTRRIRRQIAGLGLGERVRLTGSLEHAELADLLRRHHVLVMPSSYEGFGIAYLEGMGFGLPAIASSGGATWEVINQAEDGFLIQPGDVTLLAEYLSMLSLDRQQLAALSLAARRRYLLHPTWESTGKQIRDFLLGLMP